MIFTICTNRFSIISSLHLCLHCCTYACHFSYIRRNHLNADVDARLKHKLNAILLDFDTFRKKEDTKCFLFVEKNSFRTVR